jgi:hypothetical protein
MKVGEYIFLACGCVSLGIIITFVVLEVCQVTGFSIEHHWWVVAIPVVLSLLLNVIFVEVYRKLHAKKR